jgi:hypothetical protein
MIGIDKQNQCYQLCNKITFKHEQMINQIWIIFVIMVTIITANYALSIVIYDWILIKMNL